MPFPLVAAALAAVPGLFKTVSGAIQAGKGKKALKNLVRPEYFIPQEVQQASRMAQNDYLQKGLPGQALMENRVQGVTARAINDAKAVSSSSGDALDAVTKLYAGEQDQLRNIGLAAAQQDLQDAATYRQQLGVDADYADKKWDINTFQPYAQKYGEAKAQIAAGNMNVSSGLDSIGQVGSALLMGRMAADSGKTMGEIKGLSDIPKAGSVGFGITQPQGFKTTNMGGQDLLGYGKALSMMEGGLSKVNTGINQPKAPTFGTNRQMIFDPSEPFAIKWRND